jgi:hypothetical protein
VLAELVEERVAPRRPRRVPRGVKRKMSGFPLRPRAGTAGEQATLVPSTVKIVK